MANYKVIWEKNKRPTNFVIKGEKCIKFAVHPQDTREVTKWTWFHLQMPRWIDEQMDKVKLI